jgi:hypothetical protein
MNIANKERAQIFPINQPANNSYSFKNGFPICTFQIAAQDKLLDTNSLRLNGVLRIQTAAGTLPTNTKTALPNDATSGVAMNERIGVAAALNQITLSSPESNRTLEVIRNYGRFLASTMPVMHSQDDYDTNLQVGNPVSSSKSFNGARAAVNELEFSIPLRTGLLSSGQRLPMGQNGLRGLTIELQLSPDSNALSGYKIYDVATSTQILSTTIQQGASYELKNLSLTYDLLVPDDEGMARLSVPATGQLNYNSVSQIYGVLNSSDQTQSYNLGTSRTLTVHHNFIPTSHINNYAHDGFSTGKLQRSNGTTANIKRVSFLRGGQKFPLDYDLFVEQQGTENRPQAALESKFLDSIKPYQSITHTLASTYTNNQFSDQVTFDAELRDSGEPNGPPEDTDTLTDPQPIFGLGVRIDPLSNVGVDYRQVPYAVRIVSELDNSFPNSIYTYVLAQNTLMYSPQGIMVQN